MTEHPAAKLGRACAERGIPRRDALRIFEAAYDCAALAQGLGSNTKAAQVAGIERPAMTRRRARNEALAAAHGAPWARQSTLDEIENGRG